MLPSMAILMLAHVVTCCRISLERLMSSRKLRRSSGWRSCISPTSAPFGTRINQGQRVSRETRMMVASVSNSGSVSRRSSGANVMSARRAGLEGPGSRGTVRIDRATAAQAAPRPGPRPGWPPDTTVLCGWPVRPTCTTDRCGWPDSPHGIRRAPCRPGCESSGRDRSGRHP